MKQAKANHDEAAGQEQKGHGGGGHKPVSRQRIRFHLCFRVV